METPVAHKGKSLRQSRVFDLKSFVSLGYGSLRHWHNAGKGGKVF